MKVYTIPTNVTMHELLTHRFLPTKAAPPFTLGCFIKLCLVQSPSHLLPTLHGSITLVFATN